jgi:hypothetical protein
MTTIENFDRAFTAPNSFQYSVARGVARRRRGDEFPNRHIDGRYLGDHCDHDDGCPMDRREQ